MVTRYTWLHQDIKRQHLCSNCLCHICKCIQMPIKTGCLDDTKLALLRTPASCRSFESQTLATFGDEALVLGHFGRGSSCIGCRRLNKNPVFTRQTSVVEIGRKRSNAAMPQSLSLSPSSMRQEMHKQVLQEVNKEPNITNFKKRTVAVATRGLLVFDFLVTKKYEKYRKVKGTASLMLSQCLKSQALALVCQGHIPSAVAQAASWSLWGNGCVTDFVTYCNCTLLHGMVDHQSRHVSESGRTITSEPGHGKPTQFHIRRYQQ